MATGADHNAGRSNASEKLQNLLAQLFQCVTFYTGKNTEGASCTNLMKIRLKMLTPVPEGKFMIKYEQKLVSYPYVLIRSAMTLLITQLIIPEKLYIQGMKNNV